MLGIGRRRIVFVGGPSSVRQSEDRCAGLRRAVKRHSSTRASIDVVRVEELNGRTAHAALQRILAHRPDAVFCANDTMALGVLRGLFECGLAFPTTSPS